MKSQLSVCFCPLEIKRTVEHFFKKSVTLHNFTDKFNPFAFTVHLKQRSSYFGHVLGFNRFVVF